MASGSFLWLASVLAAHKDSKVPGRLRLQKTIKLLQSKGLQSEYLFSMYHYGPYCDEILEDVELLERFELAEETKQQTADGSRYYYNIELVQKPEGIPDIGNFQKWISILEGFDTLTLELAATYTSFRDSSNSHEEALSRLRLKKGSKCTEQAEKQMLSLLKKLELDYN